MPTPTWQTLVAKYEKQNNQRRNKEDKCLLNMKLDWYFRLSLTVNVTALIHIGADTTKGSSEKKLCILDGNPKTTQKHSQDTDHCSSTKKEIEKKIFWICISTTQTLQVFIIK